MLQEQANRYGALKELVRKHARNYNLNPELIAGMIAVESRGNPTAVRFEPGFFKVYVQGRPLKGYVPWSISEDTERQLRCYSFGLLQIMGNTARERGFVRESLIDLCDPEINLDMGCSIMHDLMEKYGQDTERAMFAYNAGEGTKYVRKPGDYPEKVLKAIESGKAAAFM
jgi:soluble lytic murein transglycosylase-like protein